ncbi:hypothetical protein I3843_13G070900 [Carya illinoinensis]|uniref:Uncharacterized protein n=1 Tax=Carya illinoinensis TaxID=32201 RepID=A0A922AMV6_CARIL|nr:hypothetical protein I3842_13G083000 [Carya illinoinensis]KAG7949599.1 hypothetical protein I3843_13G070900 [Carya illinoinensis]
MEATEALLQRLNILGLGPHSATAMGESGVTRRRRRRTGRATSLVAGVTITVVSMTRVSWPSSTDTVGQCVVGSLSRKRKQFLDLYESTSAPSRYFFLSSNKITQF